MLFGAFYDCFVWKQVRNQSNEKKENQKNLRAMSLSDILGWFIINEAFFTNIVVIFIVDLYRIL